MKKNKNKRISLTRETLRTLAAVELEQVIAGLGNPTGGGNQHPFTCTCDTTGGGGGGGHQEE